MVLDRCESSVRFEEKPIRVKPIRSVWTPPPPAGGAKPRSAAGSGHPGQDGPSPHTTHPMPAPLGERLRTVVSMALFLVLAGYVGFSAIRLGLLLWQRFASA